MKHYFQSIKPAYTLLTVLCFLAGELLFSTPVTAQNDTTKPAPAVVEKVSPSMELVSIQRNDNTITLTVTCKAKVKGTFRNVTGVPVVFSSGLDSTKSILGKAETNIKGVASLTFKNEGLVTDGEGKMNFTAQFDGNKLFEAAEAGLSIKKALLTITPVKQDSTLSVTAKLTDLSTGQEVPVPEAALNILVKRYFSNFKVGEGSTDSNGEVTVDFPSQLYGDAKGNITILAKIDENESFGALEAVAVQPWGQPVSDQVKELPRALWSTHPPLWMLITFIILMTTVWGHYFVIVYELFRLRKEPV